MITLPFPIPRKATPLKRLGVVIAYQNFALTRNEAAF